MNRKDVLTMCVVALGVAGIALAFFSPQPVCAKGPAEGSQPSVTVATTTFQGCTITLKASSTTIQPGESCRVTLECTNPTNRMVDFPATFAWNERSVAPMRRVELPVDLKPTPAKLKNSRPLRCIAFPHSTCSMDIEMPATGANASTRTAQLLVALGEKGDQLLMFSPSIGRPVASAQKTTQR